MLFPGGILLKPRWSISMVLFPLEISERRTSQRGLLWLGHGGVPAVMC